MTSGTTSVTVGFKPKYLCIRVTNSSEVVHRACIYDERYSTTQFQNAATGTYLSGTNLNGSASGTLKSIDSNGFTMNKYSDGSKANGEYFAIG